MKILMRLMIGAFNRPNSYLLINIRQNVLQLVSVIRRATSTIAAHDICVFEVEEYILSWGKSASPHVRVISWPSYVIKTYVILERINLRPRNRIIDIKVKEKVYF